MKLVIVSGHSGSGKSVALNTLEDIGYYCIDNLPAGLLGALAMDLGSGPKPVERAAVGIDARNIPQALNEFGDLLTGLRKQDIDCQVLFLTSDRETLVKRFSETRRPHPLSGDGLSLSESIEKEQLLMEPIAQLADLYIDTSKTTVHELRKLIRDRMDAEESSSLSLSFESFGFKHGIPNDADFVFDTRCLPNPHWQPDLRQLTGRDRPVGQYLESQQGVEDMFCDLRDFLSRWIPQFEADNRSYLTVAIGCTGGQHRSVYLAERLANHFQSRYPNVIVRHRELA